MPVSILTFRGFFYGRDKRQEGEEGKMGGERKEKGTATLGRAEGKGGDGESGEFVANKLDFPSILFRRRRRRPISSGTFVPPLFFITAIRDGAT